MNAGALIRAEVDLAAIAHNVRALAGCVSPGTRFMAVVKADAYGHGAAAVARVAIDHGASWLGVARLHEAIALRRAGIEVPILVFGGTPPAEAEGLAALEVRQAVGSLEAARALAAAASARGVRVRVHVKIDTGMGRLGFVPDALSRPGAPRPAGERLIAAIEELLRLPGLEPEGVFTHFASADQADLSSAERQLALFLELLEALRARGVAFPLRHAANSAGLLRLPEAHLDLVRAGIALYGIAPSAEFDLPVTLVPAMTLRAAVLQVKEVPAGFAVSYGGTWRAPAPTRIATLAAGYADGYPRLLSSRGRVLYRGASLPVAGRVCMDLTMVDAGAAPGIQAGDEVVLFGRDGASALPVEEVASAAGTIPYEILCGVSARVPRVYLPA
ncbi:MAG: alanine racemase [Desulfobacterales bacterium]